MRSSAKRAINRINTEFNQSDQGNAERLKELAKEDPKEIKTKLDDLTRLINANSLNIVEPASSALLSIVTYEWESGFDDPSFNSKFEDIISQLQLMLASESVIIRHNSIATIGRAHDPIVASLNDSEIVELLDRISDQITKENDQLARQNFIRAFALILRQCRIERDMSAKSFLHDSIYYNIIEKHKLKEILPDVLQRNGDINRIEQAAALALGEIFYIYPYKYEDIHMDFFEILTRISDRGGFYFETHSILMALYRLCSGEDRQHFSPLILQRLDLLSSFTSVDDGSVRYATILILNYFAEREPEEVAKVQHHIIPLIYDTDKEIQQEAIETLGMVGTGQAINSLNNLQSELGQNDPLQPTIRAAIKK